MSHVWAIWCSVVGHNWKSQITGETNLVSWPPEFDSYVVCARCGESFSFMDS